MPETRLADGSTQGINGAFEKNSSLALSAAATVGYVSDSDNERIVSMDASDICERTSCTVKVLHYTPHPIVMHSDEAVLDALLPPRLLSFFDICHNTMQTVVRVMDVHKRQML
uniref:Uncharacterized protein n=1 Tax=Lygus hesperus TaxID=30085 RepID=A0A146M347_LYGHE